MKPLKSECRFDGQLGASVAAMFLVVFVVMLWFETTHYFGKDHVGTWWSFVVLYVPLFVPIAFGLAFASGRVIGVRLTYAIALLMTITAILFCPFCVRSPTQELRNRFGESFPPDIQVIDYIEYPTFGDGMTQTWIIRPLKALPEAFFRQHSLVPFDEDENIRSKMVERVQDMLDSRLTLSEETVGWNGSSMKVVLDGAVSTAVIVRYSEPRQP